MDNIQEQNDPNEFKTLIKTNLLTT